MGSQVSLNVSMRRVTSISHGAKLSHSPMKQVETNRLRVPYEAPQAEFLPTALGQSILISGSGSLPDSLDEGDEDTFLPNP